MWVNSISALPKNNQLTVSWSTSSETNNAYFYIEASKDGVNFEKLGDKVVLSKAEHGNSSAALFYTFETDINAATLIGLSALLMAF